jgi:hypothetical protein
MTGEQPKQQAQPLLVKIVDTVGIGVSYRGPIFSLPANEDPTVVRLEDRLVIRPDEPGYYPVQPRESDPPIGQDFFIRVDFSTTGFLEMCAEDARALANAILNVTGQTT